MIVDLRDYVPGQIYKSYGSRSSIFIDPKVIIIHRVLEEKFGKRPIINNYHLGGTLSERGFRLPTSTTGAPLSQHRFGRAIDITIPGIIATIAYDEIMSNSKFLIDVGCTTIEDIAYTKSGNWIHLDCRTLDHEISTLNIVIP